jgi:hypothetical protein
MDQGQAAVLAGIAGLVGAGITAVASLGVAGIQSRLTRNREDRAALSKAYVTMMDVTLRLALRANALRDTKQFRSGMREVVNLLWRFTKPLDPMQLHDWMAGDTAGLSAAQAEIWTGGDAVGIKLTNDLVAASMDVLSEATSGTDPDKLDATVKAMAEARRKLGVHVRVVMKTKPKDADLFA